MSQADIDPKRFYNLHEIARKKCMPRGKTYTSVIQAVLRDFNLPKKARILDAIKVGEGQGARYAVLGRNLIRYIRIHKKSK